MLYTDEGFVFFALLLPLLPNFRAVRGDSALSAAELAPTQHLALQWRCARRRCTHVTALPVTRDTARVDSV